MATTTALVLNQRLSEATGDYIQEALTTLIAANTTLMSTAFQIWDNGQNNTFRDHWAYITDKNNAGKDRKIAAYYTANGGCVVQGAVFSADTALANVRIHRISYTEKLRALNQALEETYPYLHKKVDDATVYSSTSANYEYAIPTALQGGEVKDLLAQVVSNTWDRVFGWTTIDDGATRRVRLPSVFTTNTLLRFYGIAPLGTLTNPTDVVNISGEQVRLVVAYAKYKLYQQYESPVASGDVSRYERESAKAYSEYLRLRPYCAMAPPVASLIFGP